MNPLKRLREKLTPNHTAEKSDDIGGKRRANGDETRIVIRQTYLGLWHLTVYGPTESWTQTQLYMLRESAALYALWRMSDRYTIQFEYHDGPINWELADHFLNQTIEYIYLPKIKEQIDSGEFKASSLSADMHPSRWNNCVGSSCPDGADCPLRQ